jgi:Holliday junction resolvase-like predicted endonuclease
MRTDRQQAGDEAEVLVAAHLERLGWTIVARNARAGRGELDLVAVDPGPPRELVVVEVRRRSSRSFGLVEETVDRRKRARLRAAIGRLLEDGLPGGAALPALPLRVDLVVVESDVPLRHHRAIAL